MRNPKSISTLLIILSVLLFATSAATISLPTRISEVPRTTPAELQQLRSNQAVTVIDARTPGQWHRDQQKVEGAIRFSFTDNIETLKAVVPLNQTVVTYCT